MRHVRRHINKISGPGFFAQLRLEQRHKGIILMHDVQPHTADAIPRLLKELKVRGYKLMRVLPATQAAGGVEHRAAIRD